MSSEDEGFEAHIKRILDKYYRIWVDQCAKARPLQRKLPRL